MEYIFEYSDADSFENLDYERVRQAYGVCFYGDKMVILANCASEPHHPNEMLRMDPFTTEIPYNWELKHG